MIWMIVIGVLVLIFIITMFIKLEHDFKMIKAIILVVLLVLIAGSVYGWVTSNKMDLNSPKGIIGSIYSYFVWLGDTGVQIFDVTKSGIKTAGNAIRSNNTKIDYGDGRK